MSDLQTSDRDVSRAIRSWLHEERHEDASRVAGAVLDQVEATPRRRARWWPARRTEPMNRIAWLGLGAAAVVVALVIGAQLLGSGPGGFGAGSIDTPAPSVAEPTVTPDPSIAEPLPSTEADLEGSYVLSDDVGITVTIPAPGWSVTEHEAPAKNGNYSPPDGAYVFGPWHGFDFYIPSDPCQWSSTMPDSPATTLDEIVAALASQESRDASEPVDVTVDGRSGASITLHVPDDIGHAAGRFDCDQGKFCTFADAVGCHMWNAQGPGAIDELWFVDLDGEVIAVTGGYYPDTPEEDIGELRAILGSMTFSK